MKHLAMATPAQTRNGQQEGPEAASSSQNSKSSKPNLVWLSPKPTFLSSFQGLVFETEQSPFWIPPSKLWICPIELLGRALFFCLEWKCGIFYYYIFGGGVKYLSSRNVQAHLKCIYQDVYKFRLTSPNCICPQDQSRSKATQIFLD